MAGKAAPMRRGAAVPPAPRKTLLEWIDTDDGDTSGFTRPACSDAVQQLHAQLLSRADRGATEPLQPPSGMRLAPLG